MSAEVLRRAAALMRERAEASKTAFGYGPWRVGGLDEHGQYVVVPVLQAGLGSRVAADLTEDDAEHIASWHPAVALAVANWLEATALEHESDSDNERVNAFFNAFDTAPDLAALTVARAYLGESA